MTSKTLVLGLGNPILGDDGVGWRVAEAVKAHLSHLGAAVEVDFASLGGLSLMERMLGYDHVVLVDSLETGATRVGTVRSMPLYELADPTAGHSASAHDTSLMTALEAARTMDAPIPARVDVVAIEARNTYDFSEELSPEVAAAVPVAVQQVLRLLGME